MRRVQFIQHQSFLLIVSLFLVFAFVLASCGTSAGSGSGSTGNTPTPQPTSVYGGGTAEGCPNTAVVSAPPSTPNVVVKLSDAKSTIIAQVGNVIEINLPFGEKWDGPTTSEGVLQLQTPAGYAWQASKVCVWQFTAQSAGTTQLTFSGKPICKAGQICPQYIMEVPFTIQVK